MLESRMYLIFLLWICDAFVHLKSSGLHASAEPLMAVEWVLSIQYKVVSWAWSSGPQSYYWGLHFLLFKGHLPFSGQDHWCWEDRSSMKDEFWYPSILFFSFKQQAYPFLVAFLSKCKLKLSIVWKCTQVTYVRSCVLDIRGE